MHFASSQSGQSQSTPNSVASDQSVQSPNREINTPHITPHHKEDNAQNEAQHNAPGASEPLVPKEDIVRVSPASCALKRLQDSHHVDKISNSPSPSKRPKQTLKGKSLGPISIPTIIFLKKNWKSVHNFTLFTFYRSPEEH